MERLHFLPTLPCTIKITQITMKRLLTFLLFILLMVSSAISFAQGLEDFTNYPETTNAYHDGTFIGQDGSTWTYFQCRGDSAITAPTPTLGKNRTPTSEVTSGTLANGMGTLSFDYKQVFTSDVALNVLVNDVLITTVTTAGEQGAIKNSGPISVNVAGNVVIKFIQSSTSAGQVAIDNITWTAFGGGSADPEPSNYPAAFAASGSGLNIMASWTDATGTQLPAGYLVKISTSETIATPVDGTFEPDDLDLTDGAGAKKVAQGIQGYTFSGLEMSKTYYLKIFPYTNSGSIVDYKTDGTPPSANGRTQAVLHKQDFETTGLLDPWTEFSVTGDQKWVSDTISDNVFAKITGYVSGTSYQNVDWLISPSLSIPAGSSPKLEFRTAMKFGTANDKFNVLVSTDYNSGDPSASTWTDLSSQATFSTGNYTWVSSGSIDLSAYEGSNTHIAFKYDCGTDNVPTWEVDNIYVTYNSGVGINESRTSMSFSSISPNPCDDHFIVKTAGRDEYLVSLFTLEGKLIQEYRVNGEYRIYTGNLAEGVYLVSIKNTREMKTEVHRLFVQ